MSKLIGTRKSMRMITEERDRVESFRAERPQLHNRRSRIYIEQINSTIALLAGRKRKYARIVAPRKHCGAANWRRRCKAAEEAEAIIVVFILPHINIAVFCARR